MTDPPEFGSVEDVEDTIRRTTPDLSGIYPAAFGVLRGIAFGSSPDAEKVRHMANAVTAVERLVAERMASHTAPAKPVATLHYLEPGSGDGDLSDVLACGLTVATSGAGYVTDEDKVTCPACRTSAQLDHSRECREQIEERPCRFDCRARS